jgi:hypothetical protein
VWKVALVILGVAGSVITVVAFLLPLTRANPSALTISAITNTADFASQAPYVPEYLLPKSAKFLPAPPDRTAAELELHGASRAAGRWNWAHKLGAIDAENTLVQLVLTRNGTAPVQVTGLSVADVTCKAPRPGFLLTYDWNYISAHAGLAESYGAPGGARYFLTHLDGLPGYMGISQERPDFTSDALTFIGSNGRPAATPLPISISYGQETSLEVLATTFAHDCTWKLKVNWTLAGKPRSTLAPAGKNTFETTAVGIAPGEFPAVHFVSWNTSMQEWTLVNPATWGAGGGSPEGQCRAIQIYVPSRTGMHPEKFLQCF